MAEYIERERLLRRFNIDDMMNVNGTLISLEDARNTISNFPTVDAVEVIHCHECLGKSTWINDPRYGCTVCNMSGMYPKNENGYCSYAIRKGDKK